MSEMASAATAWGQLGAHLRETQLLGSIQSTLYWDQNTSMPSAGAAWRGEQLTLLATQLHARQSSVAYADLLAAAREHWCSGDRCPEQGRNLDLLEQDLRRQQSLDPALVAALAKAKAEGYDVWQQARAASDFSLFAPALQTLIDLRQEQAKQLNEPRSCWETLAQPFEPDLRLERLEALFAPLRERLPQLVAQVSSRPRPRSADWDLAEPSQQQLCDQLLSAWGRNRAITCMARSPHPFSITLGPPITASPPAWCQDSPCLAFWPPPMNGVTPSTSRGCRTRATSGLPGRWARPLQWRSMRVSRCSGKTVLPAVVPSRSSGGPVSLMLERPSAAPRTCGRR